MTAANSAVRLALDAMTRTKSLSASSRRSSDGGSGAWWLARWLLVLALAFDLLSAPLHSHHHDGVGGLLEVATLHASRDETDTHADGADHPLVSHATIAIRIDPSRLGQLPTLDGADVQQVALLSVVQLLVAVDAPPAHWRPDRSRPDFRCHRSLPPAGRAPPLHA